MRADDQRLLTKVALPQIVRTVALHHPVVLAHQRARSADLQARLADTITAFTGGTVEVALPMYASKELSQYLGHHDPGFTLQMYTHMLPSSHERARQAVDRRLARLDLRLTEQRRSRLQIGPEHEPPDNGPSLL